MKIIVFGVGCDESYFSPQSLTCQLNLAKFSILAETNTNYHDSHGVFKVFTMKIGLSTIFTIIFLISMPKYVNLQSFKVS